VKIDYGGEIPKNFVREKIIQGEEDPGGRRKHE